MLSLDWDIRLASEEQPDLAEEAIRQAYVFLLKEEGIDDPVNVSLSLVEKEEIQELNASYRHKDQVTDVLSFPTDLLSELSGLGLEIPLGDVVICWERAQEQAAEYGHSIDREIVYLAVHSLLHLLGYDHMEEEERQTMRGLEEKAMAHVDLSS